MRMTRSLAYSTMEARLAEDGLVILDGGTGTELERRGVPMDPEAWCGPATLDHLNVLEAVHLDYVEAGAEVITANTFASSRLMLAPGGWADQVLDINRAAVAAAHRARAASGRDDIVVAGSLSHMVPLVQGEARSDEARLPDLADMNAAFRELAAILRDQGCDLILLEMMYHPDRMAAAFEAALDTGLPVWAGFSVRRGADGQVLSFTQDQDIPFEETVQLLADVDVAAAGIMHSPSNVIGDALAILGDVFDGPLMAYPDSGYFKMPHWQFDSIIPPHVFLDFATSWRAAGAQVIGGCCGLSPEHIAALAPLKA